MSHLLRNLDAFLKEIGGGGGLPVFKHYLCKQLGVICNIAPVPIEDWKKITEFENLFSNLFDDLNLLKILWELLVGNVCILNSVDQCEISGSDLKKRMKASEALFDELLRSSSRNRDSRKRKVLEKQESQKSLTLPRNVIFAGKSITYRNVFTDSLAVKVAIFDNTPVYQLKDIKYMIKLDFLVIINPQGKPFSLKDLKLNTLPNLKQLFLINCGRVIKDLDGLKELVGLKTLAISQYNLTDRDLVDIYGLTDLMILYLEECNIRSLNFSKLKQLIILSLINNYITDVKLPINLVLRFLQLNNNNGVVFDTKSLGNLKYLSTLTFVNTPIEHLNMSSLINKSTILKCNTFSGVKTLIVVDMLDFTNFPNVEYLVWYNINIKFDVKILDLLRNLKKLCIVIKGPTITVEENTYLRELKQICDKIKVLLCTKMLIPSPISTAKL